MKSLYYRDYMLVNFNFEGKVRLTLVGEREKTRETAVDFAGQNLQWRAVAFKSRLVRL